MSEEVLAKAEKKALYMHDWHVRNREKMVVYNRIRYQANREERLARQAAWYRANPVKVREQGWKRQGIDITHKEYERILKHQKFKCKICGVHLTEIKKKAGLVVDHDHKTGRVRGLLCSGCNAALGSFRDSTEILGKAIEYLNAVAG